MKAQNTIFSTQATLLPRSAWLSASLKQEDFNIVAFIGDGSLSGGVAFEGLNNAGKLNDNFIVIVNDNQMAIAENHGSLYDNLRELRETNGQSEHNYFKSLGYDYIYVAEGNDLGL